MRFSQKEIYGKRRFGNFEITVARGKIKGFMGLHSKTEEGIFIIAIDQKGGSWSVDGMDALDYCKAVIQEARSNKEVLEKYVQRKPARIFVLARDIRLDSVAAIDFVRYLLKILLGVKTDSIGMKSYLSRARVLSTGLQAIEREIARHQKERPAMKKETDSGLSERDLEAITMKKYSLISRIEKVANPRALLHDLEYIQQKIQEAGKLEEQS